MIKKGVHVHGLQSDKNVDQVLKLNKIVFRLYQTFLMKIIVLFKVINLELKNRPLLSKLIPEK